MINEASRKAMKELLCEIQSGEFARKWLLENQVNRPVFNALRNQQAEHLIEKVGRKLRAMMPWINKK